MKFQKMFSKIGYVLKKNAPKILTVGGTALIVGGTVVACSEARKMDPIVEELKKKVERIHDDQEMGRKIEEVDEMTTLSRDYDNKEAARDLIKVYAVAGGKLAKLFAPGAVLIGGGLYCHHKGFAIQSNRYLAATAAAYAAKATSDNLVQAIKEKYGEEALNELRHNVSVKKGEKSDVKTYTTKNGEPIQPKLFTLIFDNKSPLYVKDAPSLNLNQIIQTQNTCNFALQHRQQTITIKEIADKLGIDWREQKKLGPAIYTWGYKYDPDNPEIIQFNYFRIKPNPNDDWVDEDEYYVIDLANCVDLYSDFK